MKLISLFLAVFYTSIFPALVWAESTEVKQDSEDAIERVEGTEEAEEIQETKEK